ncbi:hypothetical protein Rvan_0385 [Rhodomicrobium vannielii ATCC 17100]|uniref:Uncharacterized protein n=1 Tax=Rhodomicrobium vannielii (strain ATCC 17100 / DSM 162 / LMG 4299 / NCIMB 10020 / ATH 3.1.1) TaxID=648757 RepID=E3I7Q5_RHOVT|nr:hypothetical protein Rvan_0385 [Rhodomicrobium vannielii ATCC 17100]
MLSLSVSMQRIAENALVHENLAAAYNKHAASLGSEGVPGESYVCFSVKGWRQKKNSTRYQRDTARAGVGNGGLDPRPMSRSRRRPSDIRSSA